MKTQLKILIALFSFFAAMSALADPASNPPTAKNAQAKVSRQKNIEFEDGFVEGMNKRPGDYATKATKWRDKKKDHLYNKEISFERDLDESLREMRYRQ